MDAKLTERIAQEVLAALGSSGSRLAAPNEPGPQAAPAPAPAGAAEGGQGAPAPKQFVTAAMVEQRLSGSKTGTVELAANEHLTPAAADLVARRNLRVDRSAAPAARPHPRPDIRSAPGAANLIPPHSPAATAGPVGIVVDQRTEKVQSVLAALAHDGVCFTDRSASECWIANLTSLCGEVVEGKLTLGVALLPFAAEAMVIANKIKGIRAVQGTRPASVAAAVRRITANLLVLEHRLSTFHELRQMTRIFITNRMVTGLAEVAVAAIRELEGTRQCE